MNYKVLVLTLSISLMSSGTLFLKEEKKTAAQLHASHKSHGSHETHHKPHETSDKKPEDQYVKYSSFGDFFYDEDAIDMSTEMG